MVPGHKKESKSLTKNYRPISLIPVLGKIFEGLKYKDLFNHFYCNNLFTKNSIWLHGLWFLLFPTAIYCSWNQFFFNCNPTIDVKGVFLDISKALDKVWHEGLLSKLESYGIGGELLNLYKDYLQECQQRVVLDGQSSSWEALKSGVPQGSVIGPLLFWT